MTDILTINELVNLHGLVVLAGFDETVLVGNAGSSMWNYFTQSAEYGDDQPDAMDRWSRRIGEDVATAVNAHVVFPFEGPPYPPVLNWARQAGQAFPSPLSMYIHRQHGLWHAYRFALLFSEAPDVFPTEEIFTSPCQSCIDQPCLSACPVSAFSPGEYRVDDCLTYLGQDESSGCRQKGCLARRACPIAEQNQYVADHARFHMDAFLRSRYLPRK
jgi:hypothetical protein